MVKIINQEQLKQDEDTNRYKISKLQIITQQTLKTSDIDCIIQDIVQKPVGFFALVPKIKDGEKILLKGDIESAIEVRYENNFILIRDQRYLDAATKIAEAYEKNQLGEYTIIKCYNEDNPQQ